MGVQQWTEQSSYSHKTYILIVQDMINKLLSTHMSDGVIGNTEKKEIKKKIRRLNWGGLVLVKEGHLSRILREEISHAGIWERKFWTILCIWSFIWPSFFCPKTLIWTKKTLPESLLWENCIIRSRIILKNKNAHSAKRPPQVRPAAWQTPSPPTAQGTMSASGDTVC